MKKLNGDSIIAHIKEKLVKYKERQELAKSLNDMQAVVDYDIRMLPLNNLLIRITRGDFDLLTVKADPKIEDVNSEAEPMQIETGGSNILTEGGENAER